MRTFIAIDVSSEMINTLESLQSRFKTLGLHASWTRPGNMHLTLKFLGEIDPGRVPRLNEILTETVAPFGSFRVSLDGVGVFPHLRNPRVLWVGLKDEEGTLARLQSAVDRAMAGEGFPPETRKFSPHLTLARIKSPKGKQALKNELETLDQTELEPHPCVVDAVHLYESQLTPKGSIYTELANFKLNP